MTNFPNRGFYRGDREALLKEVLGVQALQPAAGREEVQPEIPTAPAPRVSETFIQREAARAGGYTGDQCSHCSSLRMKIAGHCFVCENCGTTTGCS